MGKAGKGACRASGASRVCGSGAVEMLGIVIKGVVSGKMRRDLSIWAIHVIIYSIVGIELQYI